MPSEHVRGTRRGRKQVSSDSSDNEDILEPQNLPVEDKEIDKIQDGVDVLSSMTADEMSQHLKLCMKLSAENKINMKNAFGLHLIEIMQKMVKNSARADIQQASLSLQASSKIYAGRVDALYQETCKFHGHLQNILSGSKKDKKTKNVDDGDEGLEEDTETRKSKPPKKCKSYLKTEDVLSMESEINTSSSEPHGNFITINSAFSTSRLAPKLLSSLHLISDSCMFRCGVPEVCFKPRNSLRNEPYVVPPKLESIFEKVKGLNISQSYFQTFAAASEMLFSPHMSTPKPTSLPEMFNDDDNDHFDSGPSDASMMPPPDHPDVMDAIERFDVLNITVDAFVNDISAAVTNEGVDHNLLPPNSALKKILDKGKRNSIRPSSGKSTRKKTKEPFYSGRNADSIRHLYVKGRVSTISQRILSEWTVENTSNIDLGYEFIEDLDGKCTSGTGDSLIKVEQVFDVIKQNDLQYYFKSYFNKESQLWKLSRRKMCLDLSFAGTPFRHKTEKRLCSMAPNEPDALAVSFQNLSLHESMHEPPVEIAGSPSECEAPPAFADSGDQEFLVANEPFETDIEELMVKPPDMVRPTSMKFEQRPVNLNTEKIKKLLWAIISKHLEAKCHLDNNSEPFVIFSEAYEELKCKLEREISEYISMQFAFVVLLILANEKSLLIENYEENTNLSIKQDISELETS